MGLTQRDCTRIAKYLNTRPRKRSGFRRPEEVYQCWQEMLRYRLASSTFRNGLELQAFLRSPRWRELSKHH